MKRRHALFGIAGITAWPCIALNALAQRSARPVVGLLDAGERLEWWAAFRKQMQDLGYVEGKNIAFEPRYARGDLQRLPALAQELVRLNVAVIVTSATAAALAAKRSSDTTPIVMTTGGDYVSLGLVESLARPGANVTGLSTVASELTGKRLELLREIVPGLSRLAVVWHTDNVGSSAAFRDLEASARASKVSLQNLGVRKAEDLANAFSTAAQRKTEAVFVILSPLIFAERRAIGALALKHRLPTMHGAFESAEAGGLASYGASYPDLFRRAAVYVDKILKGAKPGDLPVEQPTTFEFVINLKTAKTIGFAVPPAVLARASRVID